MMKRRDGVITVCAGSVCLIAGLLVVSMAVYACDTPVYEYTIQNWARDYYQVRYFYRGHEDKADVQANEYLASAAQGAGGNTNLSFASVDVDNLDPNATPSHQRAWERHKSEKLPFYLVTSPRGAEVFVGHLDLSAARTMVKSPKRSELSKQLSEGKQGVLVTLLGANAQENAAAKAAVHDIVAKSKENGYDVGVLEVSRNDAAEQWFVRQLLSIEDDLKDIPRPMVFGAFGRAYIVPPYVGKGITVSNLADLVAFMNGPCACEIKAANPGTDLLTDWNWDAHLAGWSGDAESQPHFAIFDVKEEKNPDGEPVVQMPLLSTTKGAAATEGTPSAQPAPAATTVAPVGPGHALPEPAASPAPARTTEPRPVEEQPGSEPAASATGQDAAPPSRVPTNPAKSEGLKEAGDAAPAKPDKASEAPGPSEQARVPQLPTAKPPPNPADEFEEEQGPSLGSNLSVGLGVTVGTVAFLALAGGVFLMRRARES